MKMRTSFWMPLGIVALFAVISYPLFNTFANDAPKVRSSTWKCTNEEKKEKCKCKTENVFKTNKKVHRVYAKGENFPPLTNVDIYITANQQWNRGDIIGPDVSTDGVETVATDSEGDFSCTKVWEVWDELLPEGFYDIVVDANQDGTYNNKDAIDGKSANPGFEVE